MKTIITIKGTHCNSCKILIEDLIKEKPDVLSCNVDYKTGKTVIEHKNPLNLETLKKELSSLGNYKIVKQ